MNMVLIITAAALKSSETLSAETTKMIERDKEEDIILTVVHIVIGTATTMEIQLMKDTWTEEAETWTHITTITIEQIIGTPITFLGAILSMIIGKVTIGQITTSRKMDIILSIIIIIIRMVNITTNMVSITIKMGTITRIRMAIITIISTIMAKITIQIRMVTIRTWIQVTIRTKILVIIRDMETPILTALIITGLQVLPVLLMGRTRPDMGRISIKHLYLRLELTKVCHTPQIPQVFHMVKLHQLLHLHLAPTKTWLPLHPWAIDHHTLQIQLQLRHPVLNILTLV